MNANGVCPFGVGGLLSSQFVKLSLRLSPGRKHFTFQSHKNANCVSNKTRTEPGRHFNSFHWYGFGAALFLCPRESI